MRKNIFILLIGIILLAGCSGRRYFDGKVTPAAIEIERFDSALLSLPADSATLRETIGQLFTDYPVFMPVFAEDIIGIYADDTSALCSMLPLFLSDTIYGFAQTNQREQELFADISLLQNTLNMAFGRIALLYPEWYMPKVTLFVSGFNASLLWINDDIAVGADMYLGSDYAYYNHVVYDYQKQTMRPECIAGDVISAYLFKQIPFTSENNRLLDNMLYRGKIMFLLQQLLPDEKPWEVMGYTHEKWQWCERNEAAIWRLMMDKQDLYKTDHLVITSYLNDGPFTSEISQDSPARLGTWIGWRIAEQYMQRNETVSLQELMAESDAQKILEQSGYRP